MKKWLKGLCCVLATLAIVPTALTGCNSDSKGGANTEYTIQYTDDTGVHTIKVKKGDVYTLEDLPERNGYEFLGLFDAETGGKQYVNASGSALGAYEASKSIVLFPQWKAKDFTLILDYQGAPVVGDRQKTVSYGTSITELPVGLSLPNHDFTGWYTQPNGAGTQIADKYGVLPENSKITETVFDLSDNDGYIRLYAGFTLWQHSVTLCFADGETETVSVSHGTHIKDVVYNTRVDGKGVLTWSKKANDTEKTEVFNGAVEKFMTLYAVEYAPVIDFDTDGGKAVAPLVAKTGSTIALPTPEKENYKFIEWQDMDGNAYTATTMPENGKKLKAVWQAKLVFDENGGTEVTDISKVANESVELPVAEKEGYIFAGWYTADKERYETTKMPAQSVVLKAGWYKSKTQKVIIKSDDEDPGHTSNIGKETVGPASDWCRDVDLSEFLPEGGGMMTIEVSYQMKLKDGTDKGFGGFYIYDNPEVSDAYLLHKYTDKVIDDEWTQHGFTATFTADSNKLYFCYVAGLTEWHYDKGSYWGQVFFKNIWMNLSYADTSKLYL